MNNCTKDQGCSCMNQPPPPMKDNLQKLKEEARITSRSGNFHCKQCDRVVSPDMNYCPECGDSLDWDKVL